MLFVRSFGISTKHVLGLLRLPAHSLIHLSYLFILLYHATESLLKYNLSVQSHCRNFEKSLMTILHLSSWCLFHNFLFLFCRVLLLYFKPGKPASHKLLCTWIHHYCFLRPCRCLPRGCIGLLYLGICFRGDNLF